MTGAFEEDPPSRVGRWLAVAAVAAMALLWLYAFSGAAREDTPDRLGDDSFAVAAEPLCASAVADIDELPSAGETTTPSARADVLDQANDRLELLLADLAALDVPDPDDANLVEQWLADWATYLDDRREFADALRDDPDAELLVTARGGRQITLTIDRFAEVNDMASCVVPLDA